MDVSFFVNVKKFYVCVLSLYFICLPLNAVSIEGLGSGAAIIAIFPIVTALCKLTYTRLLRVDRIILAHVVFISLCAFSILWSINPECSMLRTLRNFQLFCMLLSVFVFNYDHFDCDVLKRSLVWGSRIMSMIMWLFSDIKDGRLWLSGLFKEDPNVSCAYLIFGIIFSLQMILHCNSRRAKFLGILEFCVYIVTVIVTGSRGGFLVVLVSVVTYLLFQENLSGEKSLKLILLLIFLGLLISVVLMNTNETITDRFTIAHVLESGGTGRTTIWEQGINVFFRANVFHQVFGYGISTILDVFAAGQYPVILVMHNIFLEILVELGVIGLIVYLVVVFAYLKRAYLLKDKFAFSCLVGMIVMSLSVSIVCFKPCYNLLMLVLICDSDRICV